MLSDWPRITQELDSIAFSLDPESNFLAAMNSLWETLGGQNSASRPWVCRGWALVLLRGGRRLLPVPSSPGALSRVQDPHPSSQAPGAEQEALGPAGWPQDGSKKEGGNRKDCTRNAKQAFK